MVEIPNESRGPEDARGAAAEDEVQLAQAGQAAAAPTAGAQVSVTEPPEGLGELAINVEPGQDFVIEFDPALAEVTLEDANLVFTFADGDRTVLVGFAAITPPPSLILPDGTLVAGGIIVAQVGGAEEVLSLEAAAGPAFGGGNARAPTNTSAWE